MNESICKTFMGSLPDAFLCRKLTNGTTKVTTPLVFPCGDAIDIFITKDAEYYTISDLGSCIQYLELPLADKLSANQISAINNRCQSDGLMFINGEVAIQTKNERMLAVFAISVANTIVKLCESTLLRAKVENEFVSRVESLLEESGIAYARQLKFKAASGMKRVIDFTLSSKNEQALLKCIHAKSAIRYATNEAATTFLDVSNTPVYNAYKKLVIVDDTANQWDTSYIRSMKQSADTVLLWSQRSSVVKFMKDAVKHGFATRR